MDPLRGAGHERHHLSLGCPRRRKHARPAHRDEHRWSHVVNGRLALAGVILLVVSCSPTAAPSAPAAIQSSMTSTPAASPTPGAKASTPAASVQPSASASASLGRWNATGDMHAARAQQTATLLPDGRVLVAGGVDGNNDETNHALASAELYDPATGKWSATGSMRWPRAFHTATLLKNGKVLVAGGYCPGLTTPTCPHGGDPDGAIAESELYDPKTGRWKATGSMTTTRFGHTVTLLPDGRVLVAGAEHAPDDILDSAEIYDPAAGKWTKTGSMLAARWWQFAVGFGDGRVLMTGGVGPDGPEAELYDPARGTWKATGVPLSNRAQRGT